jgi:uncharacterized protein DUF6259
MLITTPRYQLALSRLNGVVLDLLDRSSKTHVVRGESGCLWGAVAATGAVTGGCPVSPGDARPPTYRWDQRSTTLTLTYKGSAPPSVSAVVAITAHTSSLDLRLTLQNDLPNVVSSVYFPSDLLGPSGTVAAGYAPTYLPGIRIRPGFFSGFDGVVYTYPSRWAFADYLAYDTVGSSLALYSVNPAPSPIVPVDIGFVREGEPGPCSGQVFCLRHAFDTWITPGTSWTSPLVRLQIGQTAQQSILSYRRDNGIDAYPSLTAKLGPGLERLSQAPLIKADLVNGVPFRDWTAQLKRLPSPALLHPVSFTAGGFDGSDPDFLPPDPAFGTTADFRGAVEQAHALGLAVMPYLNASWWSVTSPTVAALPAAAGAKEISVLDGKGTPKVDTYGDKKGYVVSPYVPYVRDRVAAVLDQWKTDVPADCLFLDQIGARPWLRDFNPAAPNPLGYDDGWLALLAPYSDRCLMVEDGWDRLASVSAGFLGGVLLMEDQFKEPDLRYGPANWEPYPLASWLLHDKVLFYQHDLYEPTLTADPKTLTWNLAFGFMLSYNWNAPADSLGNPWLDAVGSFQRALGPYYAGQPLSSYIAIASNVTRTTFGSYSVTANWDSSSAFPAGDAQVPPGGFLATSSDGAIEAGAFTGSFGGALLSPGTHYLVVQRTASSVTVHQPLGDATRLSIDLPSGWQAGTPLRVTADVQGGVSTDVTGTVDGGRFLFDCLGPTAGQPAPTYRISVG